MSALNYTTYVSQISNLMVIPSSMDEFQTMLPGMIDYAEQRLYRELDPLRQQVTSTSVVSSGVRDYTLPTYSGTYIVTDNINILTPVGAGSSNGARNQCVPVSREFIDITYPSAQFAQGIPQFFAMLSDTQVIFGPPPDAAYTAEVVGIQRPLSLSSGNSSTYLTQYCPDLFVAASMVFGSAYMRNFAADADNPQMASTWESQYQKLLQSAMGEMYRAHYESEGWTSQSPTPLATPKRS